MPAGGEQNGSSSGGAAEAATAARERRQNMSHRPERLITARVAGNSVCSQGGIPAHQAASIKVIIRVAGVLLEYQGNFALAASAWRWAVRMARSKMAALVGRRLSA